MVLLLENGLPEMPLKVNQNMVLGYHILIYHILNLHYHILNLHLYSKLANMTIMQVFAKKVKH